MSDQNEPGYDWREKAAENVKNLSGYHNAPVTEPVAAGMDFGYPGHEHLHLQPMRIMGMPEPPDPRDQVQIRPTTVRCDCTFVASSPIPRVAEDLYDQHIENGCSPEEGPAPVVVTVVRWHESLFKFLTNLVGWSVIGMALYLLLTLAD